MMKKGFINKYIRSNFTVNLKYNISFTYFNMKI